MATANPFDLLQGADGDDPSLLIAAAQQHQQKAAAAAAVAAQAAPAKLPTKPLPPQQAVREARNNDAPRRGGFGRGGAQRGRGGRGPNRDYGNGGANGFSENYGGGARGGSGAGGGEELGSEKGRGGYGGQRPYRGRPGGYPNGDAGGDAGRPRRAFERHSGTGRGYEVKRDGAGRGNWGTTDDDVIAQVNNENANTDEKVASTEARTEQEDGLAADVNKDKENPAGQDDKEEDKEMTLEEYEKIREEKRKALLAMKTEERKVEVDKDLQTMKQLSIKKGTDEVFIKLGSDKDAAKKKENDKEERAKKSLSINEFLKPAEGEKYYSQGGRGRGRGCGSFRGGFGGRATNSYAAPSIEDPGQFPTIGAK